MTDIIRIPYNDVFFYGVSLRNREEAVAESDIFSNIVMRYLRTLEPVSNRLYRTSDGNRYEYSYSFIPTRPFFWRVIKNKSVIEDIEHLSEGKYCLSYYDDQGKDVKRVIFDKDHKWLKTNYYNSIYGNTLLSSVVPKELNGETVILEYLTGATYPTTHYCCKKASCKEVEEKVFGRAPLPEISTLTNYGVLYFATEETLKIYNQILEEEEEKYAQEHKPPVYTTDEDVASGFCFSQDSFETGNGGVFSLDEASELSEDDIFFLDSKPESLNTADNTEENVEQEEIAVHIPDAEDKPFNVNADISAALEIIRSTTNVEIDSSMIFAETNQEANEEELERIFDEADTIVSAENNTESETSDEDVVLSAAIASQILREIESENADDPDFIIEMNPVEDSVVSETITEDTFGSQESTEDTQVSQVLVDDIPKGQEIFDDRDVDLLAMEDEEIDDYVKTLIDSLLNNAKSAGEEYVKTSDEGFESETEVLNEILPDITLKNVEDVSNADAVIESGREEYYFFGEYSETTGRNGRGRTLMTDGKTAYEGDYKNDMRHGVGAFYYRSGDLCYYGNWNENKRSGFGIGINSDTGISHTGNWAENKPNGIGVRFDKFGNFLYLDSHSERVNGGIRVTGFTENSLKVEFWDEKTLSIIKKEIFIDELNK